MVEIPIYNNASVSSKNDHPLGRPPGIRTFSLPGVGVLPNFLFLGGRGFELEKCSAVLKENCWNFLISFKEIGGSLKSRCSCAVSYQVLQKL